MSSYTELLRDPRWQKKRLEIMQRDGFACTHCEDANSTLNVHHCFYQSGKEPWDYPSSSLLTYCESCHKKETEFLRIMRDGLKVELGRLGAASIHYHNLAVGFARLKPERLDQAIHFIAFFLGSEDFQDLFFGMVEESMKEAAAGVAKSCPSIA